MKDLRLGEDDGPGAEAALAALLEMMEKLTSKEGLYDNLKALELKVTNRFLHCSISSPLTAPIEVPVIP